MLATRRKYHLELHLPIYQDLHKDLFRVCATKSILTDQFIVEKIM